jgi:hypothetical protein
MLQQCNFNCLNRRVAQLVGRCVDTAEVWGPNPHAPTLPLQFRSGDDEQMTNGSFQAAFTLVRIAEARLPTTGVCISQAQGQALIEAVNALKTNLACSRG